MTFLNFKEKIEELKVQIKDYIINPMKQFRLLFILCILIKSIIFVSLLDYSKSNLLDNLTYSGIYLTFIIFIYSIGYLFSHNKQIIFLLSFDLLFSILLFFDFGYYRVNGDFLGIKNILFHDTFNPSAKGIIHIKIADLLVFIDFLFLILFTFIRKIKNYDTCSIKKSLYGITASIIFFIISFFYFNNIETSAFGNKLLYYQRSPFYTLKYIGPLNYMMIHDTESIKNYIADKFTVSITKSTAIESWLQRKQKTIPDNSFKGIAKGKNVIFLQVESLENFVINKKAGNDEITPFLNSLTNKCLYFNNIYEQNNGAHSIDCDFLVNTSILPIGNHVTAVEYGENVYPNSLPRILKSEGYNSVTAHAEKPGDFNWMELHKNCFGVDKLWSIQDYNDDEDIGYGLSDKSSLSQFAHKLKDLNQPFLAQTCTLTSHGPFNLDKKYRELSLPQDIDKSYLGGYFQSLHYTDKQIEMFFNLLKEENLLDNSIIIIYGDHTGVHKYYNDSIQSLNYEDNWWKNVDRKIPLLIYSSDMPNQLIEASGGQVDILPTVCYLLGIDDYKYKNTSMGRVLVNTDTDSTVLKDTKTDTTLLRGNIKDYNEERHLLDSYPTGCDIIKTNYFYRNKN